MTTIAKSTSLSIGLVITLAIGVFFGGVALGKIEARVKAHEILESHEGTKKLYVPKGEINLQFISFQRQLDDLKAGQVIILEEIKANR